MTCEDAKKNFSLSRSLSNLASSSASRVVWRDVAMTPQPKTARRKTPRNSPLRLIDEHLAQLSRTKEGMDAMARIWASCVDVTDFDVAGAEDLGALVHQCTGPGTRRRRDRILEGLLALAPEDETVALCAVALLRPELIRISRLLARGLLAPDEAESETVTIAWEIVRAGRRRSRGRWSLEAVVNAIWTEARRVGGLRRVMAEVVPLTEDHDAPAVEADPLERCSGLLATAVAQGVVTPPQAAVIAQSRLGGLPLVEVARSLGRGYVTVKQERRRAEAALAEFARTTYLSES